MFKEGQLVIYTNGNRCEIGRIKQLTEDGKAAFVAYHSGFTGARTDLEDLKILENAYCVKETTLGGDFFSKEKPGLIETIKVSIDEIQLGLTKRVDRRVEIEDGYFDKITAYQCGPQVIRVDLHIRKKVN